MKSPSLSLRPLAAALLTAFVSCAAPGVAEAQAVRTAPLGLVPWTVPAGQVQALSLPLSEAALFSGVVTAVNGAAIQSSGAGWAAAAFGPFASNPCVIRFTSGNAQGRSIAIVSHTADTLTLTSAETLGDLVAVGDHYNIVHLDTLESLFGAAAPSLLTGADVSKVDNLVIREGGSWVTYYNDGTKWLSPKSAGTDFSGTPILPDEGVIVVRRGTTPLNLTLTGFVPAGKVVTHLPGQQTSLVANPFPIDTTLSTLGLHLDASWVAGADTTTADCVQLYSGSAWVTYFYDGAQWRDASTGQGNQDPAIAKGAAFIVIRHGSTDILHSQTAPYASN